MRKRIYSLQEACSILMVFFVVISSFSKVFAKESAYVQTLSSTRGVSSSSLPLAEKRISSRTQNLYDLGSLIDLALNKNPMTRAAWSQAKVASASVGEARALYYPWVRANFAGGYDYNYAPQVLGPNVYSRNQATVFLSMEYVLLDFGRRDADVARTVAIFNALGFTYQRKLQDTIFAVQKAYFAHEASLWRKKAAERNLAFTETLADMIHREKEAGLSADPELLKAHKRVLEARYEAETASASVKNTLGELCIVVGLPANTSLQIVETEPPVSTKKLRSTTEELIRRALLLRPDIAARAADLKASKEATKRAIADFFPVIKLQGQYINSTFGYTATDNNVSGTYNRNGISGGNGFVVASWDLFDGLERVFKVHRRQEEDKVAERNLEQAKLLATRDVWTSYNDSLAAEERVKYAEGFVSSSQETFNAVKAAMETGLTNITEFVEAASNLAAAQSELATAVADYSTTFALLAFSVGTTGPEPGRVKENLGKPGGLTGHLLSAEEGAVGKCR